MPTGSKTLEISKAKWIGNIGHQRFWQKGKNIILECRSTARLGGVTVLTKARSRLAELEQRGYQCHVQLENVTTGWSKQVPLSKLPKKPPITFMRTGDNAIVVNPGDFTDWDPEPI